MEPLTDDELRVLGCLAEKEAAVPDAYPLTLNSLRQACNQSSSRDPVVAYDDLTVQRVLDSLKARGFVRFVHPASGERATKFRHIARDALGVEADELAVLTVLVLRGPQTSGELRTRTERQFAFESVDAVETVLRRLAGREEPFVVELPRQPGQHQLRWMHLLGGPVDVDALSADAGRFERAPSRLSSSSFVADLDALLAAVSELRVRVDRLEQALGLVGEAGPDEGSGEPPDYS